MLIVFVNCFRYNLSQVEQWLRDQRLHEGGALEVMEPMIEATQLLQARKTDADVNSICDMCAQLSTSQVRCSCNLVCLSCKTVTLTLVFSDWSSSGHAHL